MPDNVVIIGAGHAAGQIVASLKQLGFGGEIKLIGEEPWHPYQRPPLSKKFLAGELPAERLFVKPKGFYEDSGVVVLRDTHINSIDRANKTVQSDDGQTHAYDSLVLALGARPREITLPGADLNGVFYLRTIQDVTNIRERLSAGSRLTIVGAGYIGLEVAAVASKMGAHVTVVEMLGRVMSRVVSPEVSAFYDAEHRRNGVDLMLNTGVDSFTGDDQITGVKLTTGETLVTDLVLVGIGVVPNTELASQAGLGVDDGVLVNDCCLTDDPSIYAIGDCTNHPNAYLGRNIRLESVHNAVEQAKTAASNICGIEKHYAQIPWFWSDQYDLKLQIVGISCGYDSNVIRGDMASRSFACIYLKDGRLIAIDAVNSARDFVQGKALIAGNAVVDPALLSNADIALKDIGYADKG